MKKPFIAIITLCYVTTCWSQVASTCVQTLRLAQSTYEQGRLHELPGLMKGCLNGLTQDGEFTNEEKRQAYKLLTMANIYLEEPDSADVSMLNLLRIDHFFEVNENVDPAEFISLYNKFRTHSIFRFGLQLAPTLNLSTAIRDYFVGSDSKGSGKYTPMVGFTIGGVFEKDFLKERLILAGEINRTTRKFVESGTEFVNPSGGVEADYEQTVNLTWWEFNPLAKYRLSRKPDGIQLFVLAGPSFNLITKGSYSDGKLNWLRGQGTVTGPEIDTSPVFKTLVYSAITGFGARLRLGPVYVNADLRAQFGLSNIVGSSRTNAEAAFDYGYISNDVRLSSVMVNLGILYAYFSPKKLIK